jgi:hypothetical protein
LGWIVHQDSPLTIHAVVAVVLLTPPSFHFTNAFL